MELGKPKDALVWFHRAAERGSAWAQVRTGIAIINLDYEAAAVLDPLRWAGVHPLDVLNDFNPQEIGFQWFLKAASQGDADGLYFLAQAYRRGQGTTLRPDEALRLYRAARDRGNARENQWFTEIGSIIQELEGEVSAFERIHRSAISGNPAAQFAVGQAYENAHGVSRDYGKARHWYDRAAAQGHQEARSHLWEIYATLNGFWDLTADELEAYRDEAANWFRKYADEGDPAAQFQLGGLYEFSFNDHDEAIRWHRKAALQGFGPSLSALNRLGAQLPHEEADEAEKSKIATVPITEDSLLQCAVLILADRKEEAMQLIQGMLNANPNATQTAQL